ncbi:MAG: hypothetical protein ACE5GZ_00410 [Gammaproteobacteria bacterium]
MFIVPFCLFWYLLLKRFYDGIAAWMQSSEILIFASNWFDLDLLTRLFIDHPPTLSTFLLIALYTAPFFAALAANDMYASDISNGYFRFLISRSRRIEIFLARFLSTFLLTALLLAIAGIAAMLISIYIEAAPLGQALLYTIQIILVVILYSTPYLACMAIVSTMAHSAIAALLLGMVGYVAILVCIFIANHTLTDTNLFAYLLPSGIRPDLVSNDPMARSMALASLPAYTFIFGFLAWAIFRKRNF